MLLLPSAFGDCFRKRAAGLNSAIHRCSNTVLPVLCIALRAADAFRIRSSSDQDLRLLAFLYCMIA